MAQNVSGNKKGLAPSQIRALEKLYNRRLNRDELVSYDFASRLLEVAESIKRRVGVLISREGEIEEVFVGSRDILYLPDLGRYRLGAGRLRRLRLVFTDLSGRDADAGIPGDIYTDLEKLRLDAVVSVKQHGNRISARWAYNVASQNLEARSVTTDEIKDLGRLELPFLEFIENLETELSAQQTELGLTGKNRALLVGVYDKADRQAEDSMNELKELVRTAGVELAGTIIQRRKPDPKTLLGKGKLEEVVLTSLRYGAELLIFDTELRPSQWRIITNSTELKVLDRSMLILDIFAQRATSSEGRLQVELAQLKYNLPRLVEKDAGLSRLTGGIGGRGPGETKLEIGRRRSRDRIAFLEKQIEKLQRQRSLRRKRRIDQGTPLVALLGYTNVGKSTLFNALTKSDVLVEDKLFATLDPAQRKLVLPGFESSSGVYVPEVVLSDTVGFIRDLPDELRNAFRATLEELYEASLLIHVVDGSDPELEDRIRSVEAILKDMDLLDTPQLVVVNKIDLIDKELVEQLCADFSAVPVSAEQGLGFEDLKAKIAGYFFSPLAREHDESEGVLRS